jgi:hypothetical protein
MAEPAKAEDLWPLVQKLSRAERIRLATLALAADSDDAAYRANPPSTGEFSSEEDSLAWDADGWEGLIE